MCAGHMVFLERAYRENSEKAAFEIEGQAVKEGPVG